MNRTAVILTTPMFGPDGLKHIRKDGASKFTIGLCVACVPPKIVAFLLSITLFLLVLILYIPGGLLAGLPVRLAEALQLASPETMANFWLCFRAPYIAALYLIWLLYRVTFA